MKLFHKWKVCYIRRTNFTRPCISFYLRLVGEFVLFLKIPVRVVERSVWKSSRGSPPSCCKRNHMVYRTGKHGIFCALCPFDVGSVLTIDVRATVMVFTEWFLTQIPSIGCPNTLDGKEEIRRRSNPSSRLFLKPEYRVTRLVVVFAHSWEREGVYKRK